MRQPAVADGSGVAAVELRAVVGHLPLEPPVLHAHFPELHLLLFPSLLLVRLIPSPRLDLLQLPFKNLEPSTLGFQRLLLAFALLAAPHQLPLSSAKLHGNLSVAFRILVNRNPLFRGRRPVLRGLERGRVSAE